MHRAQKEMEEAASNARPTTTTTMSAKLHATQPVVNKQKQLLSGIVKRKTNETLKRPLEEATEEDTSAPPARLPRLLVPGGRLPGIGPAEGFSD